MAARRKKPEKAGTLVSLLGTSQAVYDFTFLRRRQLLADDKEVKTIAKTITMSNTQPTTGGTTIYQAKLLLQAEESTVKRTLTSALSEEYAGEAETVEHEEEGGETEIENELARVQFDPLCEARVSSV